VVTYNAPGLAIGRRLAALELERKLADLPGDHDTVDVMHVFGGAAWRLASMIADHVNAPLAVEVWRAGMAEAARSLVAEARAVDRTLFIAADPLIERELLAAGGSTSRTGQSTSLRTRCIPWGVLAGAERRARDPDAGTAMAMGKPISSSEASAKQDIGYFSDDMRLYKPESIGWHMQFVRSLYPTWDDAYASQLLDRFGLISQQVVKGLSHGQRVKAMLLLILARRPKLLILDEPTNGLDPVAKHEILTELMRVVEDDSRTILYSSHNTQDVEQISDSITFIDRGQVIASNNRDEFLEKWKRIKLHAPEDWKAPDVEGLRLESHHRNLHVLSFSQFRDHVPVQLHEPGVVIEAVESMTLEEIFVSIVMRGRETNPS
jgi:ABC-2 type transport system ATP-binding protein